MRNPERIKILIDLVKDDEYKKTILNYLFQPTPGTQLEIGMPYFEIDDYIKNWNLLFNDFCNTWIENPDLRLTQVLVYNNIIPNYPGFWYYKEDSELITLLQ